MGGSCVNLFIYSEARDKYGVKVGSWAVQKSPGMAECKLCPDTTIKFLKGKVGLTQHSEGSKHRKAAESASKGSSRQIDIRDALQADPEEEDIRRKVRDFEIDLVQTFGRHGVPPAVVECVTEVMKKHATDSEIVQRVQLGRTKVSYTTEHGLGATYEKETVNKLRKCDAYSVAFDESEVNKKSELAVIVKIASEEDGLEARFYKSIDLEAGDAETITETVLDAFTEDGINYQKKLISADMDGCSTMQGKRTGVITRLVQAVPQLSSMGSSNAHNISNAMMHGVLVADPDMKEALVDVYFDLGGGQGEGAEEAEGVHEGGGHHGLQLQVHQEVRVYQVQDSENVH